MSSVRSGWNRIFGKRPTEFQRLFEILGHIPTFLSFSGQSFISFFFGQSGRRIFPLRSPMVRDWLVHTYLEESSHAPKESNIRAAIRAIEASVHAKAKNRGTVYHRVAGYGERVGPVVPNPTRIVIDLMNDAGEVVAIDPDAWDVTVGESHCLTRGRHMKELPPPTQPSDAQSILAAFRRLLNPLTTKDFHRILIWLLSAFRGSGPTPVLALEGPPSSGKTTAAHLLSRLIDPTAAPFADPTASHRDLISHVHRNWLIAFDNIDRLSARLSTFINTLAAGTSQHVRQPHDPHDPVSTHVNRPVLLTGDGLATASESLKARSLTATLAPLTPERNRPLTKIHAEFDEILPELFGLICEALSAALRNFKDVNPERLPRLADAAVWAIAAAPVLGLTEEEILAALEPDPGPEESPEDPLPGAMKALLSGRSSWNGTATELATALASPLAPKALSQKLRRQTAELAGLGLKIDFNRTGPVRAITVAWIDRVSSDASASRAASQPPTPAISTLTTNAKILPMRHAHSARPAPCAPAEGPAWACPIPSGPATSVNWRTSSRGWSCLRARQRTSAARPSSTEWRSTGFTRSVPTSG